MFLHRQSNVHRHRAANAKTDEAAFQKGNRESGLRIFINYVLDDPNAWQKMPQDAHKDMLAHAHEWDVMRPPVSCFPKSNPRQFAGSPRRRCFSPAKNPTHFLG